MTDSRFILSLPSEERDAYLCVSLNSANLPRFTTEFQLSVGLFEWLEQWRNTQTDPQTGLIFRKFQLIAAQDGALNVYHFGMSLEAVRKNAGACRSVAKYIDLKELKFIIRRFKSHFPHYTLIRHAIAHAGELLDTPKKLTESQLKTAKMTHGVTFGPGAIPMVGLSGSIYTAGINGELFSLAIDNNTTAKLVDINLQVSASFRALAAHIATLPES